MADNIKERLELVEERIEAACRRSGRKREEITLMGVTKFHPLERIEAAWKGGVRLFGESRVKEGIEKYTGFWQSHPRDGKTELHLIGTLQRNKAKAAAAFYDCIQSVDRDSLIEELGILTADRKPPLMIMLEYHTGEDTKSGYTSIDDLCVAAEKVLSFPGLKPAGLMTMAPLSGDQDIIRPAFRKLLRARDELEKRFPRSSGSNEQPWSCLSMGMTGDFEIAIEEGSTMIRIGTLLFGEKKV